MRRTSQNCKIIVRYYENCKILIRTRYYTTLGIFVIFLINKGVPQHKSIYAYTHRYFSSVVTSQINRDWI